MIYLHQLVYDAVTSVGTRPRPVAPHAPELRAVPVLVALYHPGAADPFAVVPVEARALHPARGDSPAECVLACVVRPEVICDQHVPALNAIIDQIRTEPPEPVPPTFDGVTPMLNTTAGRKDTTPTPAQENAP